MPLAHPRRMRASISMLKKRTRGVPVLVHRREDFPPLQVDDPPAPLEPLGFARAGIDQQRHKYAETPVAECQCAGAEGVDLRCIHMPTAHEYKRDSEILVGGAGFEPATPAV